MADNFKMIELTSADFSFDPSFSWKKTKLLDTAITRHNLKGKTVVVLVSTWWCPFCRILDPKFKKAAQKKILEKNNIVFVHYNPEVIDPVTKLVVNGCVGCIGYPSIYGFVNNVFTNMYGNIVNAPDEWVENGWAPAGSITSGYATYSSYMYNKINDMIAFALLLNNPKYFGIDPVTKKPRTKAPKKWAVDPKVLEREHFDMNSDYKEIQDEAEQKLINFNNYLVGDEGITTPHIILVSIIVLIIFYKKNSIKKLLKL